MFDVSGKRSSPVRASGNWLSNICKEKWPRESQAPLDSPQRCMGLADPEILNRKSIPQKSTANINRIYQYLFIALVASFLEIERSHSG